MTWYEIKAELSKIPSMPVPRWSGKAPYLCVVGPTGETDQTAAAWLATDEACYYSSTEGIGEDRSVVVRKFTLDARKYIEFARTVEFNAHSFSLYESAVFNIEREVFLSRRERPGTSTYASVLPLLGAVMDPSRAKELELLLHGRLAKSRHRFGSHLANRALERGLCGLRQR
jgi:hypothetical protein